MSKPKSPLNKNGKMNLRDEKTGRILPRHGMKGTPTWNTWRGMRKRCLCESHDHYHRYGGRGIRIDPSWDSFEQFHADMGTRPEGHTLDRIDNDGDYTPDNCRWADASTQQSNRSNANMITIGGITKNISHWANDSGISHQLIRQRVKNDWPEHRLLQIPRKR